MIFIGLYAILLLVHKNRGIHLKIGICDDNVLYLRYLKQVVDSVITKKLKQQPEDHIINHEDVIIETLKPSELSMQIANTACPYDIIITDIDMGSFNGIDFAKGINKINPSCSIIFISSYINFATDVYDAQHIYFILKSEAEIRLPKALEKAMALNFERKKHFLIFHYQNTEYRIALADITHIEALGRYLYIYERNHSYKYINSLKSIATELSGTFIRCHNSYIVNADYIRSLNRTSCILSNGITVPVSQTYSKKFQARYTAYVSNRLI